MLKKTASKAAADGSTGGVAFLTRPPQAAKTACLQVGYVEDSCELRTPLVDFFSVLR